MSIYSYAFADMTGAFVLPFVGQFILAGGNIGLSQVTIDMAQDRTDTKVMADGSVMVSFVPGENGTLSFEVAQTSDAHEYLLSWHNAVTAAAKLGDISQFAAGVCSLRNIVDGSSHMATGISPGKQPPKAYGAIGQMLTWVIPAAKIVNE